MVSFFLPCNTRHTDYKMKVDITEADQVVLWVFFFNNSTNKLNGRVTSCDFKIIQCDNHQDFAFDVKKEHVESWTLGAQDRVSILDLFNTMNRAVTDAEKPSIFKRPGTDGRFLSQNVRVISIDGTSFDSGSLAHMSFTATFPKAFKTSRAARSPACTAPSI